MPVTTRSQSRRIREIQDQQHGPIVLIERLVNNLEVSVDVQEDLPLPRLAYQPALGIIAFNLINCEEEMERKFRARLNAANTVFERNNIIAEIRAYRRTAREFEYKILTRRIEMIDDMPSMPPQCSICQSKLITNVFTHPIVLNCGHTFHVECIVHQFRFYSDKCPICRCIFSADGIRRLHLSF